MTCGNNAALILPEVANESFWFKKKFHFADRETQYVLLSAAAVINDIVVYNAEYDDLSPGRKIVEEVLKETGKLRTGAPGVAAIQSPQIRCTTYTHICFTSLS